MMFMIALDLRSNDSAVKEKLEAEIKGLGNWSNRLGDTWLLQTNNNARQVRDLLKQHVPERSVAKVFVARISRNWAGCYMGPGFPEWIGRQDFGAFTDKS